MVAIVTTMNEVQFKDIEELEVVFTTLVREDSKNRIQKRIQIE